MHDVCRGMGGIRWAAPVAIPAAGLIAVPVGERVTPNRPLIGAKEKQMSLKMVICPQCCGKRLICGPRKSIEINLD